MLDVITDNLDIWTTAQKQKKAVGRGRAKKEQGYGIKKLRELILELAVRGKLVPQDPKDEPASVLLERISPEKQKILLGGKFKSSNEKTIVDSSQFFSIPKSWEWCRLEDLAAIARGGSPRPIASYITDSDDGLNWIKIGDTDRSSRYVTQTAQKIRKEGLIKTRMVYPGDLILSNSMSFGYPYILKITGCIHDGWLVIRPPEDMLDKMYLCNLFLSIHAKTSFKNAASGAVVQNLNADKVRLLTVPLPPLAEQHRIVAKVDELMALCDQLEQEQADHQSTHQTLVKTLLNGLIETATHPSTSSGHTALDDRGSTNTVHPEHVEGCALSPVSSELVEEHFDTLFTTEDSIDQLKQTILQLAVMGKLVPQNPKDEPASDLLEKIAEEKAKLIKEGKIKKQKALPEITEDEKPFGLPEGWEWSRLGLVATIRGGKRVANGYKLLTTPTPYIYIRVSDMKNGSINDSDLHYIDENMYSKISQYIITKDDLYMTIVGATIGKCGFVPEMFDGMNLTENAARITPYFSDRFFLLKCLESSFCQSQFFDKTKQVGVQKMALGRLSSTLIPTPPLAEQHRIVTKVNQLLSLCDTLKANLNQAQTTQTQLADTIVKQAVS